MPASFSTEDIKERFVLSWYTSQIQKSIDLTGIWFMLDLKNCGLDTKEKLFMRSNIQGLIEFSWDFVVV